MNATKTHQYKGYKIRPAEYADRIQAGFRWYVQTYHQPTGLPYDSQHCHHFATLDQAKEHIKDLAEWDIANRNPIH